MALPEWMAKLFEQKATTMLLALLFAVGSMTFIGMVSCLALSDSGFSDLDGMMQLGLCLAAPTVLILGVAIGLVLPRPHAYETVEQEPKEMLHWMRGVERKGIGDAIDRVNHIALIVEDVGRALSFYTEVMGFQQIRRPNFDRHGAWLTIGNLELHLIKGKPVVHDGEDLIVSHIALDTERPLEVLKKLVEYGIPFRQNVSVPDPKKSANNREENFDSADGKVTQFFIRDPDGYYLEICNCDILTKFCLESDEAAEKTRRGNLRIAQYSEGIKIRTLMSMFTIALCYMKFRAYKKRVRANMKMGWKALLEKEMEGVERAETVDVWILDNMVKRGKTYCDICQGYSREELEETLLVAGNSPRIAVLILKVDRGDTRMAIPPSYFKSDCDANPTKIEGNLQPRRFYFEELRHGSVDSTAVARMCKPFNDRDPSKVDALKYQVMGTQDQMKQRITQKLGDFSPASVSSSKSTSASSAGKAGNSNAVGKGMVVIDVEVDAEEPGGAEAEVEEVTQEVSRAKTDISKSQKAKSGKKKGKSTKTDNA
eukprot:TRINITY_DN82079_c0_g1_i1.p1 TRINITY_DN82079_c0_g1~~TRINITY_DN82079_c0_g1_i1.p1  ORF type:complete len:541 (-),score=119.22 TRINITY_DN82079_c0_g1_i1:241-1863(-)